MRTNNNIKTEITPDQHQIILGTILGDSSLSMRSENANASLRIKHCDKDKDYVSWKYEELKSAKLFISSPKARPGRYKTGTTRSWLLCSRHLPLLTEYYKLFYPNGIKVVTEGILRELNWLGIAVWYMDDGSRQHSHRRVERSRVRLAVMGFTLVEVGVIRRWFWDRYQLLPTVLANKGLLFKVKDSRKFLDSVSPYVEQVPCMRRKLEERRSGSL